MKASTSLAAALCMAASFLWHADHAQAQGPITGATRDSGEAPRVQVAQSPAPQTGATSDAGEAPVQPSERADVPRATCRPGYVQQGFWLCMTGARGPASFVNAVLDCNDSGGRVADYHDWRYRIFRGDGLPAPVGWWLGPITADNTALFVNQANVGDYDGETSRFDLRGYACAHNLLR